MRPTRLMAMRQSPQLFVRHSLPLRSPVPVRDASRGQENEVYANWAQKEEHGGKARCIDRHRRHVH